MATITRVTPHRGEVENFTEAFNPANSRLFRPRNEVRDGPLHGAQGGGPPEFCQSKSIELCAVTILLRGLTQTVPPTRVPG
jgi:hypothetical protein